MIVCSSSLLLAACGGGDDVAEVTELPRTQTSAPGLEVPATTTDAETPTTAAPTTAPAPPAATAPAGTTPADTGGLAAPTTTTEIGPGDSEAAVVPVDLSVSGSRIEPSTVSVPAFLTLALSVRSADGREHTVRLTTPRGPVTVTAPAGGVGSAQVEGLPAGDYLLAVDGQPTDARLRVGVEPGP